MSLLGRPDWKEIIFGVGVSNPTIEWIAILQRGLDDKGLKEILCRLTDKKRLGDLLTELRGTATELEGPVSGGGHEESAEKFAKILPKSEK